MKRYVATKDEYFALYKVMPHAIDVITFNERMFDDPDTTDAERKVIHDISRDLCQSALKMVEALKNAPFG